MRETSQRTVGAACPGWIARVVALLLAITVGASVCTAQDEPPSENPASQLDSAPPAPQVGEVKIELEQCGLGNLLRPGDWNGIRLNLTDSASTQRELIVRIAGADSDGDVPLYQREITSNPGAKQGVWLYPFIPFRFDQSSALYVSVHESVEGGGYDSVNGRRPGRLLSPRAQLPPAGQVVPSTNGIIGVVTVQTERRTYGINGYAGAQVNTNEAWHPLGHERARIAEGITAADLPDRWMGYATLDALIWGSGEPTEIRAERAQALRDWVRRGGHLIIVLPNVGLSWAVKESNPIFDMMPAVNVSAEESVDMAPYRPLITRRAKALLPRTASLRTFKPVEGAGPADAMPILNGPDGRCVVVRRLVGAGAVTWVGLDLNATAFVAGNSIDADVFWNRVLGRRTATTMLDTTGNNALVGALNRQAYTFDKGIGGEINRTSNVALAVLGAFALFVLYWLLAGPLGYALLRRQNIQKHAWLAFVIAAAAFTVVSWGGATTFRPHQVSAKHLTLLDHVYGQDTQRARTWAGVLVPGYGTANIAVDQRDPLDTRSLNALAAWDPEDDTAAAWSGFPDARGYPIDTRAPDRFTFPKRSTVKQVQVDWAGAPIWKMPMVLGEADEGVGQVRAVPGAGMGASEEPLLTGVLKHELPGTLRNCVVVFNRGQSRLEPGQSKVTTYADAIKNMQAYAWTHTEWPAGETLDLSKKTAPTRGDRNQPNPPPGLAQFLNKYVPTSQLMQGWTPPNAADNYDPERLAALAFFSILPGPDAIAGANSNSQEIGAALRTATHGWDLGMWFTQPCLIIVGELKDAESPVPLYVDGERVATTGKTIVRWVYPLPPNPPAHPPEPVVAPLPGETETPNRQDDGGN